MRSLCLLLLILGGCSSKKANQSLALQGGIADQAGPSAGRTCPWESVDAVRLQRETVWIDDVPWPVGNDGGRERLEQTLALCGETDAIKPLRTWKKAEDEAHEEHQNQAEENTVRLGTTLIAGAVNEAANQAGAAASGDNSQLAHAVRDKNLEPAQSPVARGVNPELVRVRQAFIDAILD